MGASDELLAARWNSAMPVAGGPDINNLEAVVKRITGIPLASPITIGLGMTAKCQFGLPIRARGISGAGSNGLRLRDTTNGDEYLIQNVNGQITLYQNTGTEDSPAWSFRGMVPIQCICHVEENDFHNVPSSGYTVQWDGPLVEDISTMWDLAAPTRVVIPFTGYYRILAYAYTNVTTTFTGWVWAGILLNGSASAESFSNMTGYQVTSGTSPSPGFHCMHHALLSKDDYLEFSLAAQSTINVGRFSMIVERLR